MKKFNSRDDYEDFIQENKQEAVRVFEALENLALEIAPTICSRKLCHIMLSFVCNVSYQMSPDPEEAKNEILDLTLATFKGLNQLQQERIYDNYRNN